jgi:ribosomal protein S18 acetylase RimI-like enzyme
MNDDLRRAFGLVASGDMVGARTEPTALGLAVFNDDLALRYDSNYLLVDELPETVTADALIGDAERHRRRSIMVRHEPSGERLAADMAKRGWRVHHGLVMAHRGPSRRAPDTSVVREVEEPALRPLRRRELAGQPWATPMVIEQLIAAKRVIASAVEARFFAVIVDGEVVSALDLYCDGRTAQIEDVATTADHRGRGYASALVLHALAEARRTGHDLTFLVADAEDWPKELYRRLGFEDIGRYVKFVHIG